MEVKQVLRSRRPVVKVRNTTDIPAEVIKQAVRFVRPRGVSVPFTVRVSNSQHAYAGRYYHSRCHVVVRVGHRFPRIMHPYQYRQHRGKSYILASREEALVYLLAHELRHLWQGWGTEKNSSFPTGYAPGARGQFSEVDTEAYAIHMLRRWRRTARE